MNTNKMIIPVFILFSFLFYNCNTTPYVQGKQLYLSQCAHCHMEDGTGLNNLIPPLKGSTITYSEEMVCLLYNGKNDTIWKDSTFLVKEMPAFKNLSTTEVTNIINFLNHSWMNNFKEKTIKETVQDLENCIKR
ncbi:MAG: cytochrome c [Saprospiraceae bacterium]|nr:cytochrome c [Saprospiraceae bacterium]MBK6563803.1 cytochrome c [Saprospiraceae bacterium]MBK6785762.1 cytochrome c [Saprospiraceae bacterium]MBK7525423.1 cytochrome c [Saprospiraceae bacterium]MBK8081998.1 cytochrome c [Saprospiraceae bacterium]